MKSKVWYVGYGSNLSEQRFLCYIEGGTPLFGKKKYKGCTDKTLPIERRSKIIHYPLYFALPQGETKTENWGDGGVAFIRLQKDVNTETLCRMWKITKEQYEQVRNQEGRSWYNYDEIPLGEEEGIPIYAVTNKDNLDNVLLPSESYLKTIALGLKETYKFDNEEIANYLIDKKGIKGYLAKDKIIEIIENLVF